MALGTLVPVRGANFVNGNKRVRVFDVQITSGANYVTGGETLTAAMLGLTNRIDTVSSVSSARNAAGTLSVAIAVRYDAQKTVRLQAYFGAAGAASAEVAASTDLSAFTARITVTGA